MDHPKRQVGPTRGPDLSRQVAFFVTWTGIASWPEMRWCCGEPSCEWSFLGSRSAFQRFRRVEGRVSMEWREFDMEQ
jgi:hypothetical protein